MPGLWRSRLEGGGLSVPSLGLEFYALAVWVSDDGRSLDGRRPHCPLRGRVGTRLRECPLGPLLPEMGVTASFLNFKHRLSLTCAPGHQEPSKNEICHPSVTIRICFLVLFLVFT